MTRNTHALTTCSALLQESTHDDAHGSEALEVPHVRQGVPAEDTRRGTSTSGPRAHFRSTCSLPVHVSTSGPRVHFRSTCSLPVHVLTSGPRAHFRSTCSLPVTSKSRGHVHFLRTWSHPIQALETVSISSLLDSPSTVCEVQPGPTHPRRL